MSQYYGAGDKRGMRQALSFKAVLAAAAIVLYLLVCMVFPRQVLSLMVVGNSQADAIGRGREVHVPHGFNGIPMAISTICSSSLREIGRVRTPLYISVIATLVNTFFNWVLIYGNLGAPRLEVQGAAIATIIARLTEMTMFLIFIAVKRPPFSATPKELVSVDFPLFFRMLKKGSMVLGSEMLWVISENDHDSRFTMARAARTSSPVWRRASPLPISFSWRSAASQRRPALSSAPRSAAVNWTKPGRKSAGL